MPPSGIFVQRQTYPPDCCTTCYIPYKNHNNVKSKYYNNYVPLPTLFLLHMCARAMPCRAFRGTMLRPNSVAWAHALATQLPLPQSLPGLMYVPEHKVLARRRGASEQHYVCQIQEHACYGVTNKTYACLLCGIYRALIQHRNSPKTQTHLLWSTRELAISSDDFSESPRQQRSRVPTIRNTDPFDPKRACSAFLSLRPKLPFLHIHLLPKHL